MTVVHRRAAAALAAIAAALAPAAARAAPTAQCGLSLPSGPLVGADLGGAVTFTPTANDPIGFQPAVELVLPPEATYRAGTASYDVGGPLVASAPILVPSSGVIVNPYTGQPEDLVGAGLAQVGDTYLLLRYPLSNLASSAPAARATFTLAQTARATVGTPFRVQARCLYLLGKTAVNDVATDPPLATATTAHADVTPQLVRVDVSASSRTGGHTVTGATSPVDFTVRVYVAEGQTVQALTVAQDVDTRLQLVGTPTAAGASTVTPTSEPVTQGGQVSATWAELTGLHAAPAATLTFRAYVAEFDAGNPGAPVLPADGRIGEAIPSQAQITTYTLGATVVAGGPWSNTATIVPHGALVAEGLTPDPSIPEQGVTVTETIFVSDYRTFAPRDSEGTNSLRVELGSGLAYAGPTGATSLLLACDPGGAVASTLVDAVVTPPPTAPDPTTFDLTLPDLAGAGADPLPGTVTTACTVTIPSTILATYGTGGPSVYASDVIPTRATLATVIDDAGAGIDASQTEADSGLDASVHLRSFTLAKSLVGGDRFVDPGETIRWKITAAVLGGATDASQITDYLPAPIFDVTELGAGGSVGAAGSGAAVQLADTTSPYLQTLDIHYTTDARTNSITFSIPAFPFQGGSQTLAVLVAVTVQHKPADDRLTYVNLAAGTQQGSLAYRTSAAAAASFAVNEPALAVHLGATGAARATGTPVYAPALPAYASVAPGAATWSSDALAADPLPGSVSGVDAGDDVVFSAVLENTGNAPAYGVAAAIDVPAAYGVPGGLLITDGAGNPIAGATATVSGGTISLEVPRIPAVDASSGANVVVLQFSVPIGVGVQAGEVLDPAVLSLSAYTSVEAADAPNFVGTALTASARATIHDLTLAHAAVWPSPDAPDGDRIAGQAAIGDVGRYTVTIAVPEGTQRALSFTEVLPTGLGLVPGTLRIADDSDFTEGDLSGGAPASLTPTGFTWELGTLLNAHTDGVPRSLRIQYDALLKNLAGVTAASPPGASQATLTMGAPTTASSPLPSALQATAAAPVVVEPHLVVSDAISPAMPVPGGTTLTVQVTVRHAGGSTAPARDVAYALTLPAGALSAPSAASLAQDPAGCDGPTISGQTIAFTCSRLAPGQVEVLTFQTTVPASSAIASQFSLSSVASPVLTWMSVPGATRVAGGFVARTGSTADPGGQANTYAAKDSTQIQVTPTAATKTLVGGTTRTIGEMVAWDVNLSFPVGTTTAPMIDALPTGLAFVPGSETLSFSNPDPSTLSWDGGGGALPAPVLSNSNRTATWNLGTTTRLAGGSGALSFRVQAQVQDLQGISSGTVLDANALTPPGGSTLQADHAITVVEPALQVSTTASTTTADAGDVITWTTTIAHAAGSTAPAYDVALHYVLAAKLGAGAVDTSGCPDGVNPAGRFGASGSNATVDLTLDQLPLTRSCVLTFTTTLASTVLANETLASPAVQTFQWRSLADADAHGAERTYPVTPAALPDIAVPNYAIHKTRTSAAQAPIGQAITYRIAVDVPESDLTAFTVTDTLPHGMEFVSATVDASAQNLECSPAPCASITASVSGSVGSGSSRVATWNFVKIANRTQSTATATKPLYIDVTARIANIAANGSTILSYTNPASANAVTASAAAVTLIEPTVSISVSPSPTTADAGDTVAWTATLTSGSANAATAYDVLAQYTLPGHLTPGSGAVGACTGGSNPAVSLVASGADTLVTLSLDSLASSSTCRFTFTTPLAGGVWAGESLKASAQSLRWRSLPDLTAQGVERTKTITPATPATVQVPKVGVTKALTSGASAAIAEPVHYHLSVTLPDTGATPLAVTDTLPAGMQLVGATVAFPGGQFTCSPTPCSDVLAAETGALGAGSQLTETWDFGTVATSGNTASLGTHTFTIDVTARIADIPANGSTISSYLNAATAGGVSASPPAPVTLVQPAVAITLVPSATTADAGDTIDWTATFTASGAAAYDVAAHYVLPAHLAAGGLSSTTCTGGAASLGASGGNTLVDLSLTSLAAGASCKILFTTPLDPAVQAGESLAASPGQTLQWHSQPHASALGAERTSTATPAAPATIAVPALTLSKARTSPTGPGVSVGETVVYRVVIGLPEGRTPGVQLVDTLPAGLRLVSARIVNAGGDVACTPACADGAAVTPVVAGQALTFALGQVEPTSTIATPRQHTLTVEVTTALAAVAGNTAGATIAANTAQVRSTLSAPATAASDTLTVEEPALAVTAITSDAASPDAGNLVTFTATLATPAFSHLSPTAHGVSLHLTLPGTLVPGAIDLADCPGATPTARSYVRSGGVTTLDVALGALALPVTDCRIHFGATLAPEVLAGEVLSVDTAIGSSWLAFASAPADGALYRVPVPAYGFAVAPLSLAYALASADRAPPGGLVEYDATVHVPEGHAPITLDAVLPDGLVFRAATLRTDASLSCAPTACPAGAALAPTASSGAHLTFDLGTVTNAGTAATTSPRDLTVHISAAVANAAANQAGAALAASTATLDGGAPEAAPGVRVVEPALSSTISIAPAAPVDAGDDVAISTTVSNGWSVDGADAYDVEVAFALPPELQGQPGTITASGCIVDEGRSAVSDGALRIHLDHLPTGAVLGTSGECTLTAVLRPTDAAVYGATYAAGGASALTWASTSTGDADTRDGSLATPLDDYRSPLGFDVPISTATALAEEFVTGSSASLVTGDPALAIGETATYRVRVTLPEGTTPGVVVTDTPPRGLRLVSVAMDRDPAQGCVAPACSFRDPAALLDGASGEARAFDLGTVVLPGTAAQGGTLPLLITVQAVADPGLVPVSANMVSLTVGGVPAGPPAASPVVIVRPAPAVTLTVSDDAPRGGDTVHVTATIVNRGTGPACDPHLTVALPSGLTPVQPGSLALSLPAGTCLAAGAQRALELDARVADDMPPEAVTVSATLGTYATLPAGGVTEDPARDGVDSNGDGHIDEPGDATATARLLAVAPRLVLTKAAAVIGGGPLRPGGELAYTLRVVNAGTFAARAVVLGDPLPLANAEYVPGSATTSQGAVDVTAGILTARLGDVGPGAVEVTFRLRVKDPVATAEPLSNQATLATGDGYGGRLSDDPATPAPDDPTVVPIERDPACASDSDCLLDQWCDAGAHTCRTDLPHGEGTCQPGAPHAGAQCNCDPRLPASSCLAPGVDACDPHDGVCGLVNGSPCAGPGDVVCRSLVCNADGRCGDPDGAGCDPSVLPNLSCRSGVCDPGTRQCGLPPGEVCRAARECRSKVCGLDGRCGELNGTPCTDPRTCRSAVCNADGHCGDPLGTPCQAGATCRSNTCDAGRCVEPCSGDEACAAGFYCEPGDHLCRPARGPDAACAAGHAGRDCAAGACGADGRCGLGDGEACTDASACRSASCARGHCDASCTADADCAGDRSCDAASRACAPRLENGAACTPDASGHRACRSGLCAADGKCGTPDALACASAAACRSALCTEAGVCAAQGCSTDDDCLFGAYCDRARGACTPRLGNGAACDRSAVCASAICDTDGTCGAPDRAPCDVLAPSPQCRSTACNPDDDACGLTGGEACTAPTECRMGVCDAVDGQCGLSPGAACTVDSLCRSQTCLEGVCTVCTTDEACGPDGFCDFPVGQCAPRRPPNDACERGAQCTRGVCGRARTCVGGFQEGVGVSGSACSTAGQTPLWLGLAGLALLAVRRRGRRRPR